MKIYDSKFNNRLAGSIIMLALIIIFLPPLLEVNKKKLMMN
ncbi:hypothetical protein [Candidatus Palibaumannia cicadellinicola]|nr:hypothetical protein [Candidatus Baumannia cicadellinicola]